MPSFNIDKLLTSIDHVHKGIYLSGSYALKHPERVQDLGITAVLRLDAVDRNKGQWATGSFHLLDMPFSDGAAIPDGVLERGMNFIYDQVHSGRKILVHCHMGMSRSVTVVMAYLIKYEGMTLAEAYHAIVRSRPVARPHHELLWSLVQHFDLPYQQDDVVNYRFVDRLAKV